MYTDQYSFISRHFPLALDLGCGRGHLAKHVEKVWCKVIFSQILLVKNSLLWCTQIPSQIILLTKYLQKEYC